jgi:hypothetical protein
MINPAAVKNELWLEAVPKLQFWNELASVYKK